MSDVAEDLDGFRQHARTWIRKHLQPADDEVGVLRDLGSQERELAAVEHDRELQRALHDAGLAGLCVPEEYGGRGLSRAHQDVLNEEIAGFEYPARFQAPTLCQCMAVILDFGTEEQKQRLVPPILRGDALWAQFLSEPSGGSDVAGALTTATRDGDEWLLNGSKVWTTGAWWSDWGLCLARTDWDVPKHRGLTVFMFPIHQDGIEVRRIEMLSGSKEFCEEFLTDVRVPDRDRLGEVNDGWTVGTRWMFHERMATNSSYVTRPAGRREYGGAESGILEVARAAGRLDDPRVRDLVGEFETLKTVGAHLNDRIARGVTSGALSDQASSIGRLFHGMQSERLGTIAFEIAGTAGGAWVDDDGVLAERGIDFLMRQVGSIAGGTTEMSRNVLSERVLGMPRERRLDKDVAFRDVPRGGLAIRGRVTLGDGDALRRWVDKLEIRDVIERSVRHIDDQDAVAFADLFTDDGLLQLAGTVFAGRDALRAMFGGGEPVKWTEPGELLKQPGMTHLTANPVIDVDGDIATAETDMITFRRGDDGRAKITLLARYRDRFRRVGDGRWLISSRTGVSLAVPGEEGTDAEWTRALTTMPDELRAKFHDDG